MEKRDYKQLPEAIREAVFAAEDAYEAYVDGDPSTEARNLGRCKEIMTDLLVVIESRKNQALIDALA